MEEAETEEMWLREKVSFDAAYGGERVIAHVYLPKNGSTSFQAVVFSPGSVALLQENFVPSAIESGLGFLVQSGRALIFPI